MVMRVRILNGIATGTEGTIRWSDDQGAVIDFENNLTEDGEEVFGPYFYRHGEYEII